MTDNKTEIERLKQIRLDADNKLKELEDNLEENVIKRKKLDELKNKLSNIQSRIEYEKGQIFTFEFEANGIKNDICKIEGHNWCKEERECDRRSRYERDSEDMPNMCCKKCNKKQMLDDRLIEASVKIYGKY